MGDREILGVLQTVNLGEIKAGESAKAKAAADDVKAYAQEMIRDHRAGQDAVQAAVKAAGATRMSELSKTLSTHNRESMTRLGRLQRGAFDRAYMTDQVEMHRTVLAAIDGELLPRATHAKVKDALTSTRATVAAHLAKAQAVLAKLGG
jgi:putative membrane protein